MDVRGRAVGERKKEFRRLDDARRRRRRYSCDNKSRCVAERRDGGGENRASTARGTRPETCAVDSAVRATGHARRRCVRVHRVQRRVVRRINLRRCLRAVSRCVMHRTHVQRRGLGQGDGEPHGEERGEHASGERAAHGTNIGATPSHAYSFGVDDARCVASDAFSKIAAVVRSHMHDGRGPGT